MSAKLRFIIFCLYVVFAIIFLSVHGYSAARDIDAYINRSQIAADREDMMQYLLVLQENWEIRGMTQGYTAIIFKKVDNDLSLHYQSITRIIERLKSISDLPKNETAYQVALDDIRGTIREIPNPSMGWLWVHYGWWIGLIGLALLGWWLIHEDVWRM